MMEVHSQESLSYVTEVKVSVVKDCDCCDEDKHKIEEEGRKRKEISPWLCLPLPTLAPGDRLKSTGKVSESGCSSDKRGDRYVIYCIAHCFQLLWLP